MKLCLLGVSPVCIWLDSSHWLQSSLLYWSIYYWGLSLVLVSIHYQHCEDIFSFPNLFPVLLLLIHCTTSLVLRHFFVLPYLHLLLHLFNSLHFKFNLYYLSFALWIVRSENSSVPLLPLLPASLVSSVYSWIKMHSFESSSSSIYELWEKFHYGGEVLEILWLFPCKADEQRGGWDICPRIKYWALVPTCLP